jgi:hypothetical protein
MHVHGIALICMTIVAPLLISSVQYGLVRLLITGLSLAVFGACVLIAWVIARKMRETAVEPPATTMPEVETRSHGIACFILAAPLLAFGALAPFAGRFRLTMFRGILTNITLQHEAVIFCGLGLMAWGLAFALMGMHYVTGRYRWCANLALGAAVLGWLLIAVALWIHLDSQPEP